MFGDVGDRPGELWLLGALAHVELASGDAGRGPRAPRHRAQHLRGAGHARHARLDALGARRDPPARRRRRARQRTAGGRARQTWSTCGDAWGLERCDALALEFRLAEGAFQPAKAALSPRPTLVLEGSTPRGAPPRMGRVDACLRPVRPATTRPILFRIAPPLRGGAIRRPLSHPFMYRRHRSYLDDVFPDRLRMALDQPDRQPARPFLRARAQRCPAARRDDRREPAQDRRALRRVRRARRAAPGLPRDLRRALGEGGDRRPRVHRARRGQGRSRRHLGAQSLRMDRHAVRRGPHRRDPGRDRPDLHARRARLRPQQGGRERARHGPRLPLCGLRGHARRRAPELLLAARDDRARGGLGERSCADASYASTASSPSARRASSSTTRSRSSSRRARRRLRRA